MLFIREQQKEGSRGGQRGEKSTLEQVEGEVRMETGRGVNLDRFGKDVWHP